MPTQNDRLTVKHFIETERALKCGNNRATRDALDFPLLYKASQVHTRFV